MMSAIDPQKPRDCQCLCGIPLGGDAVLFHAEGKLLWVNPACRDSIQKAGESSKSKQQLVIEDAGSGGWDLIC